MTKKNRLAFLICYLSYTAIYVARLNLSMAAPALRDMCMLTEFQLGLLGSVFSIVYAVGRLLVGAVSDRRPPFVLICTGLLLCGASNLAVGLFPPFIGILLLWGVNAFAQSMLWSSVLCVISESYDPETAKKKTALMATAVASGNILGILVNLFLIETLGVRWAFLIPGAVTLAAAGAAYLSVRHIPAPTAGTEKAHRSLLQLVREPAVNRAILPVAFHGVMKDNVTLWMTIYLIDRFGVDLQETALSLLLIPGAGLLGRISYPLLYKLCRGREHRVSCLALSVCLAASVLLCFRQITFLPAVLSLSVVYAAVSVVNTSFLSIYPLRFADSGNVASVSGVMDFCTYLGAGAAALVYGAAIQRFGYLSMFLSWSVLSALCILLIAFRLARASRSTPAA